MHRKMPLQLHAALAGVLALSIGACGSPAEQNNPSAIASGADSLTELRRIDPGASRLLNGETDEFRRRVAGARGRPVVVNQWASWCRPCRAEFPFFQRLAKRYGAQVAFLGVNSRDSSVAARRFLSSYPTPYAHIADPDAQVARVFRGGRAWPTTAFYDPTGKLTFTHQGAYATQAALDADIRRYTRR